MSLHTQIRGQMIEAMKAKDATKLNVLRGLLTAFTNELVAKGRKPDEELGDEDGLNVISRGVKQRKDSIEQFEKGSRPDLAEVEKTELSILQAYLPAQMSKEEIFAYVQEKAQAGFDKAKAGQFMGGIMKELKGKADSALVKETIDKLLA